jgi:hypothetical protein
MIEGTYYVVSSGVTDDVLNGRLFFDRDTAQYVAGARSRLMGVAGRYRVYTVTLKLANEQEGDQCPPT